MAMKDRYYTIDGQMVGYKKSAVRKDFLTDALGSVTAEVDQTGNTRTFDGRYQPYGGSLSAAGSRGSFGWVGSWGYRETGLSGSSHYVRARHYSKVSGNWTTVDLLWSKQLAYSYVRARCVRYIDPQGLAPRVDAECRCQRCINGKPTFDPNYHPIADAAKKLCDGLKKCLGNPKCKKILLLCLNTCDLPNGGSQMLSFLEKKCGPNDDFALGCGGMLCAAAELQVSGGANAVTSPFSCSINICVTKTETPCGTPFSTDFILNAICYKPSSKDLVKTIGHELAHCGGIASDGGLFGDSQNSIRGDCVGDCLTNIWKYMK